MFEKLAKHSAAIITLILFGMLYGNILVFKGSVKYIFLAVAYAVGMVVLYTLLKKAEPWLTPVRTQIITLFIWDVIIFGGGFVVYGFREYMIIDMKEVYDSAWHLIRNSGELGERSWYFIRCKNNFGFLLLSYIVHHTGFRRFGIMQNTEASVNFVTYVNFAFVLFAMWLTVMVIRKINSSPRMHIIALIIVGSYLPFYLWSPLFYTDTTTMFFPPLMLYIYHRFTKTDGIVRIVLSAFAGLVCMAGYALKGSVPILLIAFLIMLVIRADKNSIKQVAVCCVVAVVAFGASYKLYDNYYYNSGIIDFSTRQQNELPLELWFLFASHQPAEWYMEEYNYMLSLPDIETRKSEAVRMIKENYASYSPKELADFIRDKNMLIWGEESFTGLDYLYNAYTGSWTHNFIIPGYPFYAPFRYLCNFIHLGTLLLFLFSGFTEFFKKETDLYTMAKITLVGVLIFLSFWERNARYVLTFTPLILVCCTEAIGFIQRKIFSKSVDKL